MNYGIKRIIFITVILIILFTSGVFASRAEFNNVVIRFSNGLEIDVRTSKTDVKEILEENNILILEDEFVEPEEKIDFTKTIRIKKKDELPEGNDQLLSLQHEEIVSSYGNISEKIITEKKEIPFKTVNRTSDAYSSNNTSVIIQKGRNGLKEIKSRVKYNGKTEIERVELSSKVIRKPVDKIVQVVPQVTSRGGSRSNLAGTAAQRNNARTVTFEATAYCACTICCGPNAIGRTANGSVPQAYYTVAADNNLYRFGTVFYLDHFKNSPNNGWFEMQDTGGAIKGNRLDIYFDSHYEALQFGRRNVEVLVYER